MYGGDWLYTWKGFLVGAVIYFLVFGLWHNYQEKKRKKRYAALEEIFKDFYMILDDIKALGIDGSAKQLGEIYDKLEALREDLENFY